jgi:hypothetical protein
VDPVEQNAACQRLVQGILGALPFLLSPSRSSSPASSGRQSSSVDYATPSSRAPQFRPDFCPTPKPCYGDGQVDTLDSIYTEGDLWVEHNRNCQVVAVGHSEDATVPPPLTTTDFDKHGRFIDRYNDTYTRGGLASEDSPSESFGDTWPSTGGCSESSVQDMPDATGSVVSLRTEPTLIKQHTALEPVPLPGFFARCGQLLDMAVAKASVWVRSLV